MTPSERRTACVRLLAEIDQRLAAAENLAACPYLEPNEQCFVAGQIAYRRNAIMRIEGLLNESKGG